MATKKWFVVVDDEEMGPLGPGGLRKLVRSGEVAADTMVRREDHQYLVRADHVRGLFEDETSEADAPEKMHGPFTSMRWLGWSLAAGMVAWVVVGVWGMISALSQHNTALQIAAGANRPLTDAGAPFLGVGGVIVGVLFLLTGAGFVYWLRCARINLPCLIQARIHYSRSWSIVAWFFPFLNLVRPYQVVEEIDRLSAEAAADGNASVGAQRMLLVPWWLSTLAFAAAAATYKLMPVATAEQIATAAVVHVVASIAVAFAAAFATAIVLRVSFEQERAHDNHPEPVKLHHEFRSRHRGASVEVTS